MLILEIGKKYKTRNGGIATITHRDDSSGNHGYIFGGYVKSKDSDRIAYYTFNGNYVNYKESPFDIVALV